VGKLNLLSKIVQDHGGSMVTSEEAASHVIDWNEDVDSTPDSADDFIRILEVKGPTDAVALPGGAKIEARSGCALVHWWYYPDSYNEWIPDTEISAGDSPDLASVGVPSRDKWYVCCRYILDCEVFNEWGNPVDYENENSEALAAEEAALEQLSAAAGAQEGAMAGDEPSRAALTKKAKGRKRFSQLATSAGDKDRLQSARDAPILGALSGAEKLMPDAIPPSLRPGSSAQILDLGSAGGDSKLSGGPDVGSKRSAADAQLDTAAVAECVLPTGASEPAWFQHGAASEFEAQVLGQTCTADPADYVKVRNGIIALCTQSPLQYITATECRRKLPGDVSKILQVHEFLNAFAIINSRARREARPDAPSSLLTASSATLASGHAHKAATGVAAHWSAAEDARLLKLIEAHRGAQGSNVDWKAVSAALQQEFGAVHSAADCAARFVERGLGEGAESASAGGDLVSLIRKLAEVTRCLSPPLRIQHV
jgi:SWI/SNF related-matrix-associated actin-dependent regulator of chromatin subfamily C